MIKIDIAGTLMQTLPVSKDGHRIEIRGFGVFEPRPRKRGMGRNIKTGASVDIPKGRSIRFKPGKDLRDIEVK